MAWVVPCPVGKVPGNESQSKSQRPLLFFVFFPPLSPFFLSCFTHPATNGSNAVASLRLAVIFREQRISA